MPSENLDLVFMPGDNAPGGFTEKHLSTQPKAYLTEQDEPETGPTRSKEQNAITASIHKSLPTHQRAAPRVLFSAVDLYGTIQSTSPQEGPVKLVDRQIGRRMLVIKCPPGNTKGGYIGHNIDAITAGFSWLVSPSDPPLYLETEDAIWCYGVTGQAAGDTMQAAALFDPLDK